MAVENYASQNISAGNVSLTKKVLSSHYATVMVDYADLDDDIEIVLTQTVDGTNYAVAYNDLNQPIRKRILKGTGTDTAFNVTGLYCTDIVIKINVLNATTGTAQVDLLY